MTLRKRLTVFAVVTAFLLASVVGCARRRNVPHDVPQPARMTVTPSPYPHAWETRG
jgi:hypothetical protein